jgi:hypothetical protein
MHNKVLLIRFQQLRVSRTALTILISTENNERAGVLPLTNALKQWYRFADVIVNSEWTLMLIALKYE